MDSNIIGALIGATGLIVVNQWVLHLQNRRRAKEKAEEELTKDNRLAFLLENFPPHLHDDHAGISYPAGMHPGGGSRRREP